ncbi:MAG TPA: hypothetical protein H9695_12510 [Candidatus Mediterraneibacter excrementigallinarum]|nr:hypothetical protein [Candidatus Mediterraneibacter excrementigallinarum]
MYPNITGWIKVDLRELQTADSGIISGRQGLGTPGLWLVAVAKNGKRKIPFPFFIF